MPAIINYPSPNHGLRTAPVKYIVVHGTWMADDHAARDRLCDPEAKVSSHYLIYRDGTLYQLVADDHVAWHAGQSAWGGDTALNDSSIGIEIGNAGEGQGEAYNNAQYQALEALLEALLARHNLGPAAVLGHSDIAPHRKDDPGAHFDWARLEARSLATPWQPVGTAVDPMISLRNWGYVGEDSHVLAAFQRRYLPQHVSGMLCPTTRKFIATGQV